ncbi:uncharacterized protein LOC124818087 [Hydra vulgaris]|uniref:Uncharacterized protein LOC124818087 n=1 Tax=Hydra vulgaris TaxID=6087 RepID=A0ABM4BSC0_HYDVU
MDTGSSEPRNMFDGTNKMMSIPERIVLSAGYDGNDNEDEARSKYTITFDEPPIINPDEVMAGMHSPPSVLTIDHSSGIYKRNSPNWHQEGDGADVNDSESSLFQSTQDKFDPEDDYSSIVSPKRSVMIAGQEDYYGNSFEDMQTMQQYYASMQRRLGILENELEYQNRLSNVWKYLLLTLTIINPIIINYLFFNRRR